MANTVSSFNTFVTRTTISSSAVNANFDNMRGDRIPINTDTATASNLTHGLGTTEHRWNDSYIKKIFLGSTSTSWSILDATSAVDDFQIHLNGTTAFGLDGDGGVVLKELSTTPSSNPASGYTKFYKKSSGGLFMLESDGTETELITSIRAKMRLNSSDSMTNNSWSLVNLDTNVIESGNIDVTTGANRIIVKEAGDYMITGQISFDGTTTGSRGVRITKNGSSFVENLNAPVPSSTFDSYCDASDLQPLAVNDYIQLEGFQSSGGNIDAMPGTQTFLIVTRA